MKFSEIKDLISGRIKPKFGDIEQIKIIKQAELRLEKLTKGIELDIHVDDEASSNVEYLHKADLLCVCGCYVSFEIYSDSEDEDPYLFDEINEGCSNCFREYQTYVEPYNFLFAKLV